MTTVTAEAPVIPAAGRLGMRSLRLVAVAAIVIGLPFLVSDYHVFQLTQILVYAIALIGLNLLTGFSGQISLGNGAFYAIGGYTSVILIKHAGFPYWATLPVAAALCFGVGYAFGRSVARLEGLYLALATFALATATPQILKLDAIEHWTGGFQGVVINKPASPIADQVNNDQWLYFFVLAVTVVMFIVATNLVRGRSGRALQALRDQPIAASAMGVDVAYYKSVAFGWSAMFTGIAGGLGVLVAGFVSPESFTIYLSIQLLTGAVVGGIASIYWTLFGAAFIEVLPDIANKISPAAPAAIYGILLIVCMMVMPGGMAGLVRSARAWHARSSTHRTRT
jgi:branched-chain amino acid transport system permease protein